MTNLLNFVLSTEMNDCKVEDMQKTESGRTLLEMISTLVIIGTLSVAAVRLYNYVTVKIKAQNTAKLIKTLAFERQNFAMNAKTAGRMLVTGPHSDLYVENGAPGNHSKYFWVETTLSNKDFCDALKKSDLIQADLIEVDNEIEGNCHDNSKLAFYFKKNVSTNESLTWIDEGGTVHPCPTAALGCNEQGEATACEEGYYLTEGTCHNCGPHVASCTDENTPLACMDGYEMHGSICAEPAKACLVDKDCDACGDCGEDGYCTQSCLIPIPDENEECADNDCIIYDNTTQTCKYACRRLEYLESFGNKQYIDTGIKNKDTLSFDFKFRYISQSVDYSSIMGTRKSGGTNSGDQISFSRGSTQTNGSWVGWGMNQLELAYDSLNLGTDYTCHFNRENFVLTASGGNNGTLSVSGYAGNFTASNYNIYLFGRNANGSLRNPSNARIYYFKIYDGSTLLRDFVPVIDPNNIPAMFDRKEKKLYYNSGSDNFRTN